MISIYVLSDPRTGDVRYVGKTNNLKLRLYGHLLEKGRRTRKHFWIRSLHRQGLKPILEAIEEFPDESGDTLWPDAERYWIAMFRFWGFKLCNHDSGGNSGYRKSDITKARQSAAMTGKRHSAATIKKIRISKTNPSMETRSKIRDANLGKKHSEETVARMRASHLGHECSRETRAKIGSVNRGSIRTEEERAKIRAARARQVFSEESKMKMGSAFRGKKRSPKTIARMREAQKRRRELERTR